MRNNIINKLFLGALTISFISCTSQYMDINSNPYQPGSLAADDYALGSAMSNLAGCVYLVMLIQHSLQIVCWEDHVEGILPTPRVHGHLQFPISIRQMTGQGCS